jgi:hypothetical protein
LFIFPARKSFGKVKHPQEPSEQVFVYLFLFYVNNFQPMLVLFVQRYKKWGTLAERVALLRLNKFAGDFSIPGEIAEGENCAERFR